MNARDEALARGLKVAMVAGYLSACWDHGVNKNGQVVVGTMERPYAEVFERVLREHGLFDQETIDQLGPVVVVPRSIRQMFDRGVPS